MPDPHTTESFGPLTDAQKDAAIAGALGWTHHCPPLHEPGGSEPWWQRPGRSSRYGASPPYWTGDDPALCREMRDALQAWVLEHYPTYELRCCWWAEDGTYEIVLIPNDDGYDDPETWPLEVMGDTEAQAWGNALVAGGLVPKEDSS